MGGRPPMPMAWLLERMGDDRPCPWLGCWKGWGTTAHAHGLVVGKDGGRPPMPMVWLLDRMGEDCPCPWLPKERGQDRPWLCRARRGGV
eukprot:350534-Chlamydomonas_euryale.AAC.1